MQDEHNVISGPPELHKPKESSFSKHILNSLELGGYEDALVNGVTGESMTYHEILQKSINLAVSLRQLGFKKGDVLCIVSENRFEFTITAFAVIYLGGVITSLNPAYTTGEIKHALSLSKPRFAVCSPYTIQNMKIVAKELYFIESFVLFGNEPVTGTHNYNDLVMKNEDTRSFKPADVNPKEDLVAILYSSGTTGMAKGVMLTHDNFLCATGILKWNMEVSKRRPGVTTVFSVIPWFHAYGFATNATFLSLHYKMVFAIKFEPKSFLEIIERQKVNLTLTVPPIILFLGKHPLVTKYNLSSLKELWCAAAPLSKELQDATAERLINLECMKQAYGMTETTMGVLVDISNGKKVGSSGQIVPGTKIKVVDVDTGKTLGPYKNGELCVKGGVVMKGYVGDLTSTSAIFDKDGWLHTGDICYYDHDQYFFIVDRLKELIKYKGFQVPPAELEAVLLQHEEVKDAAVIGLPDERAGELPLAFVIRQPNSTITEKEIKAFVADKVSSAKQLRGGVRFVDEIPKNPSGKILRRHLRDQLKIEMRSKL